MIRVLSIYTFLFLLLMGSYTQVLPLFTLGELSLLSLGVLLQSFLHLQLHWKKVLRNSTYTHKFDLVSLRPGLLGTLVLASILFLIVLAWGQMLYRIGIYQRRYEFALMWVFVFFFCERLPVLIWQYWKNNHVILFAEDQIIYSGYYLQRLPLKRLQAIKGEWKIIRGDKEKWQLDEFSEIKFKSYPLQGITLGLKYLRLADEQRIQSAIGEIIKSHDPPLSEALKFLKIEAIGST